MEPARLPRDVEPERSFSTAPRKRRRRTAEELRELERRETALEARVRAVLERERADVALLGRVGSDLSAHRFEGEAPEFTHVGFALRDDERWRIDHLLNVGGTGRGELRRQALLDFFRDDPFAWKIAVLVPSPSLQRRVSSVLASPRRERLHTPVYSRIAYPFSTRYANSNQWVAEILAAALHGAGSRAEAQALLAADGLRPNVLLGVGLVRQALAGLFSRNARLDDHPRRDRLRGRLSFLLESAVRAYVCAIDDVRAFEIVALEDAASRRPDSSRAPIA